MNKNFKDIKNKVFSSKKVRYGSAAVIFSVVFVAFVVLANVVLTLIDARTGGLYVDLTTNKVYSVSEASEKALEGVDKPIQIIFCQEKDKVVDNGYLNPIKMLAENYEEKFDNVEIVYKDKISNPGYFRKFYKTSTDTITNTSVIIYCEETGLSKIYSIPNMYVKSTDDYGNEYYFAFNGESKLTSGILSVARNEENMLRAGIVTGHGESTNHNLSHFLEDYGYSVSTVDLKALSQAQVNEYDILVVCNPMSDFIAVGSSAEENSTNELEKISSYVLDNFGDVLFFFDPKTNNSDRTNLFAMLEQRFGISIDDNYLVTDTALCYDTSTASFLGTFNTDTGSLGYSLHSPVSTKNGAVPAAFGPACLIQLTKPGSSSITVSPVITTSEAGVALLSDSNYKTASRVPVMAVSRLYKIIDNVEMSGNVFVVGSTGFISELSNSSFSNNDILKRMLIVTGNDSIIAEIDYKVLDESSIQVANRIPEEMTRKLVIIVPVIISIIGIAVFVKRKYL